MHLADVSIEFFVHLGSLSVGLFGDAGAELALVRINERYAHTQRSEVNSTIDVSSFPSPSHRRCGYWHAVIL
jgi:hypothetical protein